MADLNDFFAKKDKKKQKAKYTTINDIDQKLRQKDIKKESVEIPLPDEEWNVFEEKIVDYTGLKILDMNLEGDEDVENAKEDESHCPWSTPETQGSAEPKGEVKPVERDTKGWKTIEAPTEQEKPTPKVGAYIPPHLRESQTLVAPRKVRTKTIEAPAEQETPKVNAYVPPHLRNRQTIVAPKKVKSEPEEMFPSLPTTSKLASIW